MIDIDALVKELFGTFPRTREDDSKYFAKRAYWNIENSLHWILDISFREGESRARKDNSAENFDVLRLRQFAYNILKADTLFKGSFSDKQFKCMIGLNFLDSILLYQSLKC